MKKDKIKKIINTDNFYEYLKSLKLPIGLNKKHEDKLWNELEAEEIRLENKIQKKHTESKAHSFKPFFKFSLSFAVIIIIIITSVFIFSRLFFYDFSKINIALKKGNFYLNDKLTSKDTIKIKKGTRIRTEDKSEINLTFSNYYNLSLGEKSGIEFISNRQKKKDLITKIYLHNGKISCSVKLPTKDSLFLIQTDPAFFTVHGTKFEIEIMKNNNVQLQVDKGVVEISNMIRLNKKNKKTLLQYNEIHKIMENITGKKVLVQINEKIVVNKNEIEKIQEDIDLLIAELELSNGNPEKLKKIRKKALDLKDKSGRIITSTQENKTGQWNVKKLPMTPGITLEEKNTFFTGDGSNIYIASDKNSKIYCLDINTGKLKWEFTDERITRITGGIALYKNQLVFSTPDNIFILYKTGKLKNSLSINDGPIFGASPVTADGKLFIPGSQKIYVYDGKNIESLNNIKKAYGQLFLSAENNFLYYLDLNSRTVTLFDLEREKPTDYFSKLKERSFISPVISDNYFYIMDVAGNIYKYSLNNYNDKPAIVSSKITVNSIPVIHKDYLYFIANNGALYKINTKSFKSPIKIIQADKSPDPDKYLNKKPLLFDSKIIYGSDQGKLYFYDTDNNISGSIELQQTNKKNPLIGTPLKIKNIIYTADSKCNIYRIEIK